MRCPRFAIFAIATACGIGALACGSAGPEPETAAATESDAWGVDTTGDPPGTWYEMPNKGDIGTDSTAQRLSVLELTVIPQNRSDRGRAKVLVDESDIPFDGEMHQTVHIALPAGEHQLNIDVVVPGDDGPRTFVKSGELSFVNPEGCRLAVQAVVHESDDPRIHFQQKLSCVGANPLAVIPEPGPVPDAPNGKDVAAAERWLRQRHADASDALAYVGLAMGAVRTTRDREVLDCLSETLVEIQNIEAAMRDMSQQTIGSSELPRQLKAVRRMAERLRNVQLAASMCA